MPVFSAVLSYIIAASCPDLTVVTAGTLSAGGPTSKFTGSRITALIVAYLYEMETEQNYAYHHNTKTENALVLHQKVLDLSRVHSCSIAK